LIFPWLLRAPQGLLINWVLVDEHGSVDLGMVPGIRVLYSQGDVFWTTDDKP
jgi:hypothetical protein